MSLLAACSAGGNSTQPALSFLMDAVLRAGLATANHVQPLQKLYASSWQADVTEGFGGQKLCLWYDM